MKLLPLPLLFSFLFIPAIRAQTAEAPAVPKKVQSILREYERTVEQAAKRAIQQLEQVKQAETQQGNLEGALAVRQKIEELAAVAGASESPFLLRKVTVNSTDSMGTSIGPAKQGDRITVQYVSGNWRLNATSPRVSPDDAEFRSRVRKALSVSPWSASLTVNQNVSSFCRPTPNHVRS